MKDQASLPTMRIKSTTIAHFRGISNLQLNFEMQTTVLSGVNGVGKSTILDALSTQLSTIDFAAGDFIKSKPVKQEDIQSSFDGYELSVVVDLFGQEVIYTEASVKKPGVNKQIQPIRSMQARTNSVLPEMDRISPLIAYYSATRAAIEIPERIRPRKSSLLLGSPSESLLIEGIDFRHFFAWFKDQEDLENEGRLEHPNHRDEALSAVRSAIERFTSFEGLRVRRKTPMRMTVRKSGIELSVNQLSDGERNLLAMVGDIARRLALLNPNTDARAILAGQGVVLIDEIELHLHPKWQRDIIVNLEKTFPNCQFIVTTHSPQVLSHVHENQVWILRLNAKGEVEAIRPQATFGMDSNRILEEVMEVPERPKEAKDRIEQLFALLGSNDSARAKLELNELEIQYPDLPELSQARALLRRKEIIGR